MPTRNHIKAARYGSRLEVTKYSKPLILGRPPIIFKRRERSKFTFKSRQNIWRVQRRIRQFVGVLSHFCGSPSFATFTYTTKEYDVQKAIADWRTFTRRMKRHFPDVAFVRVPERHKDGGVHFHAVIFGLPEQLPCKMKKMHKKWIHDCPQTRNCERKLRLLRDAWQKGFVDLQEVREKDSIGRYIAKYLTKGDPDWSLFGNHVATSNQKFREKIREARAKGILWEMSGYRSPVALAFALNDHLTRAFLKTTRTFETHWLGMAIHEVYELDTLMECG